jgi:acetyl esterase/lipase
MISVPENDSTPDLKKIFAKTGVSIFSIDYTLAPTARAPTQVVEQYAALEYLVENRESGIDRKRIGIMGESAGGGLTACLVHWTMVRLFFHQSVINIPLERWNSDY